MNKYLQNKNLLAFGVIASLLNQIFDINELGTVGDAVQAAAASGATPGMILGAGIVAALTTIFKGDDDEEKKK